jgi:hypothetical protein
MLLFSFSPSFLYYIQFFCPHLRWAKSTTPTVSFGPLDA